MNPVARLMRLASKMATAHGRPDDARLVRATRSGDTIAVHLASEHLKNRDLTIMDASSLIDEIDADDAHAHHLKARISEMVRMEARQEAIGTASASSAPAWSIAVPRLFRDMLKRVGLEVQQVLDDPGMRHWEATPTPRSDVTIENVSVHSGRMEGTLTFQREGATYLKIVAGSHEDGHCMIRMTGVDLPETMRVAAEGMALETVVDHEDMSTCAGLKVMRVRRRLVSDTVETVITLAPDFVWGAKAPEDADVTWRDIREGILLPEA